MKLLRTDNGIARERLGTEPIKTLLISMAIPSIVAMLMQALYNTADSIFVSKISQGSFAAVTLAFPVQMIIGAMSTGIGVGVNSSISRNLGAKKPGDASKAAANGLSLGFAALIIMILFGIFGAGPYIRMYTNDPEVIEAGTIYIRTISVLAFGAIFTQNTFSILQGSGNMTIPMVSQLAGGASVLILDPVFIFVFKMGVLGAAVASSLAQSISMCIGLYGVFRINKQNLPVTIRGFRPDIPIMKDILAVGVPAMLTQATTSVVSGIISKLIAGFGTAAISVFGGFNRISSFGILPVFGVTRGMTPILGYSYGAKDRDRFIETRNAALKYGTAFTLVAGLIFIIAPGMILWMLSADAGMTAIGNIAFRILGATLTFAGASIVLQQTFPPAKRSYLTMTSTILRQVVYMLPLCILFSRLWGLTGIWIGYACADVLNMIVVIFMSIWFRKKVLDTLDKEESDK